MKGQVVIDSFPESAERFRDRYAIVVIDVIRATTTATTAVSLGRRVFPARTAHEAFEIASSLKDPLLVGELGGHMPDGFDLNNSPAQIAKRKDVHRPIVLVSSSGTQLLMEAAGSHAVYTGCFRNITALACYLAGRHERIALMGSRTRGQFRLEDQMGCAWVAEKLVELGYFLENKQTVECVDRWRGVSPEAIAWGRSAEYLRQSGQEEDLQFILDHFDDLYLVPCLVQSELVPVSGRVEAVNPI